MLTINKSSQCQPIFVCEDLDQSITKTKQLLRLFVGGLSNDANWRNLKYHFRQVGKDQ